MGYVSQPQRSSNGTAFSIGSTFEFYPGNDPSSTPFEAIVTSRVRVGNSDLSIIILDRNVNPSEVDIVTLSMNDYLKEADIDGNGFVNFLDISPFINLF